MGVSPWSSADNYNHSVSVLLFYPLSLHSIMALSLASNLLILLILSSLDWLPSPGSTFLTDWDHTTSSGKLLVFLQLCVTTS